MTGRGRRRAGRSVLAFVVAASASLAPQTAASAEPPAPRPAPSAAPSPASPPESPSEILGAPAAFGSADLAEPRIEVAQGTALHELPDARAAALAVVDAPSELPLVERRGGWALVRYGAFKGWVPLAREAGGAGPAGALPARAADREILARALAALPGEDTRRELGPYAVYTDVGDSKLLGRLEAVAAGLEATYRSRYGLDSGSAAGQAVVLFSREADYRAFASGDLAYAGLEEGGHAGFGVAALFAEGKKDWQVSALLVHELTHLINGRALGPRTPPWLEEGLADDLGDSRVDAAGRLLPGSLGGEESVSERKASSAAGRDRIEITVTTEGAYAALGRLTRLLNRGRLPPLAELTGLSWREIVDPGLREDAYAESAFFVRYLLDGGDEALARGFRSYLAAIAAGGDGGPAALRASLGRDWAELDAGFGRWLRKLDV